MPTPSTSKLSENFMDHLRRHSSARRRPCLVVESVCATIAPCDGYSPPRLRSQAWLTLHRRLPRSIPTTDPQRLSLPASLQDFRFSSYPPNFSAKPCHQCRPDRSLLTATRREQSIGTASMERGFKPSMSRLSAHCSVPSA